MLAFVLLGLPSWADEGMWIPMLLKKYNIEDMQKAGFKLTAEDQRIFTILTRLR